MKILSAYNISVELEDNDVVAFDSSSFLWIRSGENLYVSAGPYDQNKLPSTLSVHSAGCFSKDEKGVKTLEWRLYGTGV